MDEVKAAHLFVRGRVQGVYFRAGTEKVARELGLAGWVRNCEDGSVEILAEGSQEAVDRLIEWCHRGPILANVKQVETDWRTPEGLSSFEIR